MKSIRDYNKIINISDNTLNKVIYSLDYILFEDDSEVNCNISIGDYLLLKDIKRLLDSEHDIFINVGFRS